MFVLSDVIFSKLPSKCVVNVAWSCVDFVLPKQFSSINNAFVLPKNRKQKVMLYGGLLKGNFKGSNWPALVVGTYKLISSKIPFT